MKTVQWTARILTGVAILFMFIFSLDVFEGGGSFGTKILGFLVHNIPVFIYALLLVLSLKKEMAAGILIIAVTLVLMLKFRVFSSNIAALVIFIPFLVSGILFLISWYITKSKRNNSERCHKI